MPLQIAADQARRLVLALQGLADPPRRRWRVTFYPMIVSFRHKGLKLLFDKGDGRRVLAEHVGKIERILARLEEPSEVSHMDLFGFRLHPLRGDLAGHRSVTVSGNWRIVFRFEGGDASEVDLVDYHREG